MSREARPPAPRRVLVLGGTSEIAAAIVRELAKGGGAREVLLAGRNAEGLGNAALGLREAGCAIVQTMLLEARPADCEQAGGHGAALSTARSRLGGIDLVILAVGVLGERGGLPAPQDLQGAVEVLEVNVVGAGSLLLYSASALREQGHGTIAVLSSVAAEHPRASNAVYCASKAGLDALALGLADALHGSGVRVMVVRPGFVRTRMTHGLQAPPLACEAETVARATVRGLRGDTAIVWAPARLRWAMVALGLLPRALLRRLPL